ncbi:hypothetical protein XELAEV_18011276mg [Xenopus laevis]|uniref:Ig-like domain-containing protein n=1 Tax=Xenopus laevis TaxID=8355 RepID=A0A974HXJ9_XENLA|nr:hypothetical protein XELAEV_18011276mg [Xenopus laevis]
MSNPLSLMAQLWLLTATYLMCPGEVLSQHQVRVPQGPLHRTEGSSVHLWCNVSHSSAGGFEWSVFPAHSPSQKLQIISSMDPRFSYAVYRERLAVRKEIYLERVGTGTGRLHITNLKARDAGEYECHTPNTEENYYGTYSASVRLTVIPDLLRVLSVSPEWVSVEDHEPLTLGCEVSSGTHYHTHISVTWIRRNKEASHPVLTLSRDFIISAGRSFQWRHQAGEIGLEKVSATLYHLRFTRLHSIDQAEYYCQASEWIQDPDETWYPLTTKRSRATRVQFSSQGTAGSGLTHAKPKAGGEMLSGEMMSAVRSSSFVWAESQTLPIILCLLLLQSWPS